jgi:hypothetical protein
MLRADVLVIEAQTDDLAARIDYREFVITARCVG